MAVCVCMCVWHGCAHVHVLEPLNFFFKACIITAHTAVIVASSQGIFVVSPVSSSGVMQREHLKNITHLLAHLSPAGLENCYCLGRWDFFFF